MNNQVKIFLSIIGLLILGTIAAVLLQPKSTPAAPGKYEALAQCIKDSGATFYGAFWCPHCQAEEADFQMTRQALAAIGLYTECSTADGTAQTQVCIDKKIQSYPTWVFKDGSTLTGTIPLAQLAQKTGCTVPQ
ncbi:MAG: thioredoxin domain-containing protein [Candidatus Pacebacteria bacterium]|nr:thioredoxin domain-containing protein [Candidatus Paceibacterota bacterium]